jgi:hypothetical protein
LLLLFGEEKENPLGEEKNAPSVKRRYPLSTKRK